jgi:hypothetical protein
VNNKDEFFLGFGGRKVANDMSESDKASADPSCLEACLFTAAAVPTVGAIPPRLSEYLSEQYR